MAHNEHSEKNGFEEEYQDLLKVSSSMIQGIQTQMENWAQSQNNLTQYQRKYVDNLKDAVGQLTDQKSVMSTLKDLQSRRNGLMADYKKYGVESYKTAAEDLNISITALDLWNKRVEAIKAVNGAAESLTESFGQSLDNITHHLSEIPLIGGMLSKIAHGPVEHLKESFKEAAGGFVVSFGKALMSGKSGLQALKFAGSEAFASIVASINPVTLAIGGILVALSMGFLRFHEIEKAASEFKTTTGLASADLHDIEHTVGTISTKFAKLGVNASDVSKYMQDFTAAMDGITIPAESTVEALAVMNKNFGVASANASSVNKAFQNMGGFSEEAATSLTLSAVEMSNMVGVSPDKVIKDMADNAGTAYEYFRGSPQELVKAAVYAAKMGSSIKDMTSSANKLLDFEESISKELEASALLGTNLDFSKARELAYTGDLLGMQKELTKELANVGDINKLSSYEKQALVDATGQELDTLINTQRIYNKFGSLDEARLAAANDLIASGKDIANVSREELEAQTERMGKQQKMQDMMTQMGNKLSALGTVLFDAFAPVAGLLLSGLSGAIDILSAVLIPTFQVLGEVIKIAVWPFQHLGDIFKGLIGYIKEYYDYIIAAGVGLALNAAWVNKTAIATAYTNTLEAIGAGWAKAKALWAEREVIFTNLGAIAQAAWNTVKEIGIGLMNGSILKSIADWAISSAASVAKNPYFGWIAAPIVAAAAWGLGKSYFGKAGDVYSPADGKTQISTKEGGLFELSPNDDVLAAPGLGEAMKNGGGGSGIVATSGGEGGGVANLINSLIAEMQGIRNDLATGKVAVYMDGQLVTSKIASVASKNPVT